MKLKKTLPRGYTEIANFVDNCSSKTFANNFKNQAMETVIDSFLKECYRKRLSVVKSLLDLMLKNFNNDPKTSVVALILSRCDANKALSSIVKFIKAANTPDKLKRKLLLVLEKYEAIEEIPKLVKTFLDKEWLAEYAITSILSCIGPNGEDIGTLFQYLAGQDVEFYHTLTANLTHHTNEQSIWLLGVLAEFPQESIAETAIKALGYRKSPLAYEILDNLITHRESKNELRMSSLNRLTQSGITKVNQRLLIPHKCYLSWIDGHGNNILLVSRRSGRGRLFMVTFMLHEQEGINDCSVWSNISTFEMESLIKGLENQVGLKQIDYTLGIKIVEDALSKVVEQKRILTPTFLFARRIFGSQRLTPKSYKVDLTNMGIEYVQKKWESLLQVSGQLMEEFPFKEWCLDHTAAREFVKNRRNLINGKKMRKDSINQFIKILIMPEHEKWSDRFLMTAEFLHRTSPRAYRRQIEICLSIYIAITKGQLFTSIPFMFSLAKSSINQIREKLQNKA